MSTFLEDHPAWDDVNEQLLSVDVGGGAEVMSEPTEADLLGELFRCERYLSLFPTGMPKRACLRRQLERLPSTDALGKPLPLESWPPAKPFCAKECELGRQNLVTIAAAAIQAGACRSCGSALVGGGACPGCAARALDAGRAVPSGNLPKTALGKAPVSSRIWTQEVPDVPIGAPGLPRPARERRPPAAPAARIEAEDLEDEDDVDEPPEAAEEGPMAKSTAKKQCRICGKGLRIDNTKGICGRRCKPKEGAAPAKTLRVGAVAGREAVNPGKPNGAPPEAFEDLLVRRSALTEELAELDKAIRARVETLKEQLDQVAEVLGEVG